MNKLRLTLGSLCLFAGLWAGTAGAQSDNAAQAAVWTPKTLNFTYMGFTTKYSCDGLYDAVRAALLQLGARKDIQIRRTGCTALSGHPEQFPGVRVKMNVVAPIDPVKGAPAGAVPINAHWKTISLKLDSSPLSTQPGSCELVEQINQKIVPLFTTRNLKFSATCIPHQQSATGPMLQADVLVADEKAVAER